MSDETKGSTFRVTSEGQSGGLTVGQILVNPEPTVNMSPEAADYMSKLGALYVAHRFPNHKVWNFDTGADDMVHSELRALGLLKIMGLTGGPWVLTDAGQRWVLQNRK